MEKKDIVILIAAFTAIGFSLYKKYFKKDDGKINSGNSPKSGSSFSSSGKDDDYEPYSKK